MNSKKESSSTGQQWKDVNNSSSSQLPAFIESLSPSQQFVTIAGSMFLFFGVHNLLQEAIMKVPGFEGVMLTYMEVLG
jgi:adenosine 3'-phospho 5'-phosphosulfate transporter B3